MAATDFINTKYDTNSGFTVKAKIDTASVAFAGTPPATAIDIPVTAIISRSKRQAGIHSRHAVLSREIGTAPNQFTKYKRVALLTPARATAVEALIGTTVAVGGEDWTVQAVKGETIV